MTRTRLTAWPRTAIAALILGWMVGPVAARQASHEQSRESWQRVSDIFAALGAVPGTVVADVGAGGGFFTERLARAVGPDGRVLAVDVDASALGRIADRVRAAGLTNVETVHGRVDDPTLPAASLDGALIVNAYHEMREHQAMLTRIRDALKPTGRLVIVEPTSESGGSDGRDAQARRHQIAARFVQEDARAAGFRIVSLEEPFVQRPSRDYEYMLVLAPAVASTASVGRSGGEASSADVESAELRIAAAEFAALHRTGGVIVLDVRGPTEYARGHIPGARLAPMSRQRMPTGVCHRARCAAPAAASASAMPMCRSPSFGSHSAGWNISDCGKPAPGSPTPRPLIEKSSRCVKPSQQ